MTILNLAQRYQKRPSEILNISNDYIAFCFDEACQYILYMIEEKNIQPNFKNDKQNDFLQKMINGLF